MNTARVKTQKSKGCVKSFGSFELNYPQNLHGIIEPLEFETTVKSINEKCHSVLSKKYLLLFLPTLVGLILSIVGIAKIVKEGNDDMNHAENNSGTVSISSSGQSISSSMSSSGQGLSSSISSSSSSISSSSSSSSSSISSGSSSGFSTSFSSGFSTNFPKYDNIIDVSVSKPSPVDYSAGIALLVIGFILMFIGCCAYGISLYIFTKKVVKKIEAELEVVNTHFSSRRITWLLESEMQVKYIPDYEYNTHRGNKAYMNGVRFDRDNRPYREELVYFIEIQFPAGNNPQFSIGSGGAQVSFGIGGSSNNGYNSISMNNI